MRDRTFGCNEQSLSVDIICLELEQLFHGQLKICSQAYGGRQGGGAATFNIDDAALTDPYAVCQLFLRDP